MELKPSRLGREDRMVWSSTKDEVYSVKSGYHFFHKLKLMSLIDINVENGDYDMKEKVWKPLWGATSLPKARMLACRACHEKLLVLSNLAKRKIVTDSCCPQCKENEETIIHVLRDCLRAKKVWRR